MKVKVQIVKDGDSIVLEDGQEVRYIGVDAPEEWTPCYWEAKKQNQIFVEGKTVLLKFYNQRKRDRGTRLLAQVYVDDILVNAEMIKRGFDTVRVEYLNEKDVNKFIALQEEAKRSKLGLWGDCPPSPEPDYIVNLKSKKFHRRTCQWVKKISVENKDSVKTREEALKEGFDPCKLCQP